MPEFALIAAEMVRVEAALWALKPYPRQQKLIGLEVSALRRRAAALPVRLGNEMARMYACNAARELKAAHGDSSEPSSCAPRGQ